MNCKLIESILECGIVHSIKNINIIEQKLQKLNSSSNNVSEKNNKENELLVVEDNSSKIEVIDNENNLMNEKNVETTMENENLNSDKNKSIESIKMNENEEINNEETNTNNNKTKENGSEIKRNITSNFEVLIEINDNKKVYTENDERMKASDDDKTNSTESKEKPDTSEVNVDIIEEEKKKLLKNIMKYFSIIESSLDTLYLFSAHLKEEPVTKDIRNNNSKTTFNPKIIKRIVNFIYQSNNDSNNNKPEPKVSILKFAHILENM